MSKISTNNAPSITPLFMFLTVISIACLIAANIIATKIVSIFGFFLPAGIIVFPITYILGDVLTEVYGFEAARRAIWLGFLANLLVVIAIVIGQSLPSAPFWSNQSSYEKILGFTPRLLVASFTAYLIGSFTNSFVLSKMKIMTKGKILWARTIGSTIFGEGLDSLIFILIAFVAVLPSGALPILIVTQWLFKTFYEVIMTPFTYVVISYVKKLEGRDVYDKKANYNPFAMRTK